MTLVVHSLLQFIYGKRTFVETILYRKREINREHPKAYLPVVLHHFSHLIKDKIKDETTGLNFFSSPTSTRAESTMSDVAKSNVDDETVRSTDFDMATDEDNISDEKQLKLDEDSSTKSEDQQMTRVMSVIFEEDKSRSDGQSVFVPEVSI